MAEQFTTMVLKVDLQCCKCYKKVKKVLCKFPQIRDQIYDVKQNTVTIKVVCCCPEKIMQKIRCKGGKSITSIEIKPPEKPKDPEKDKPDKPADKKPDKPADKKPDKPADKKPDKPADKKPDIPADKKPDKPKVTFADPPTKTKPQPIPKPPEPAPKPSEPILACPPRYPIPFGVCCTECYEGRGGGPCQQLGYGRPLPCYDYGRPVYDSWGGGCYRGYGYYSISRGGYFCEENPSACKIM